MEKSEMIAMLILLKSDTNHSSINEWVKEFDVIESNVSAVISNMSKDSNEI